MLCGMDPGIYAYDGYWLFRTQQYHFMNPVRHGGLSNFLFLDNHVAAYNPLVEVDRLSNWEASFAIPPYIGWRPGD